MDIADQIEALYAGLGTSRRPIVRKLGGALNKASRVVDVLAGVPLSEAAAGAFAEEPPDLADVRANYPKVQERFRQQRVQAQEHEQAARDDARRQQIEEEMNRAQAEVDTNPAEFYKRLAASEADPEMRAGLQGLVSAHTPQELSMTDLTTGRRLRINGPPGSDIQEDRVPTMPGPPLPERQMTVSQGLNPGVRSYTPTAQPSASMMQSTVLPEGARPSAVQDALAVRQLEEIRHPELAIARNPQVQAARANAQGDVQRAQLQFGRPTQNTEQFIHAQQIADPNSHLYDRVREDAQQRVLAEFAANQVKTPDGKPVDLSKMAPHEVEQLAAIRVKDAQSQAVNDVMGRMIQTYSQRPLRETADFGGI